VITELDYLYHSGPIPGEPSYRKITYNSMINPVDIIPDIVGTGSLIKHFAYDNRGRMIFFATVFVPGGAGTSFPHWHNYKDDQYDRIIIDSDYNSGDAGNLENAHNYSYIQLSYDKLNRIDREITKYFPLGPTNEFIVDTAYYNYDERGNLAGQFYANDSNPSPLLTNKLWRSLERDYSVNNRVKPATFNDHRLPTLYKDPELPYIGVFEVGGGSSLDVAIHYDCSGDPD